MGGKLMKSQPTKAYVYQPLPPQDDGKFYGVGGLHLFGLDFDERLQGITKKDAEEISKVCNEDPEFAASFVRAIKTRLGL